MSIIQPPPDHRFDHVSVAYDEDADTVFITPPNGAYARVGGSQLKRTVKIDGDKLASYFVRVNKLARPDRQRTFVWHNDTSRKIEIPLSVGNHDYLVSAIDAVLLRRRSRGDAAQAHRQTQAVVDSLQRYLKAPPP